MMHHQSKFRKTLSFTFVISVLIFSTFAFLNTSAAAQMGTADSLNATAAQQNTTPIANQTLSKSQLGDSDNTTAGSEDIVHVVWSDSTPTTPEIFHRRAGGLFDPTARITLSNIPGVTQVLGEWPAIAISGPEVYVVWHDTTGEGTPLTSGLGRVKTAVPRSVLQLM